jgi:hypothetical protein
MSSAFYPLGMETFNNRAIPGNYESWKGTGSYSFPVAITSGNIRPLTNNDPSNFASGAFGRARPLKQYRKGTTTPVPIIVQDPNNPNKYIYMYSNRAVKSSTSTTLIDQTMWGPGRFSVKQNSPNEVNESIQLNEDCKTCDGIGLVTSYKPETYLTDNPREVTTNYPGTIPGVATICCNPERKARRMCLPTSTNLKKNYYQTLQQYRQNRCQTYEQRAFNFKIGIDNAIDTYDLTNNPLISPCQLANAKPGDPIANLNMYVANCYPNIDYSTSTQAYIILQAYQYINNAGLLSQQDVINFNNLKIKTFADFNKFLSALSSGNSAKAIAIFERVLSNPYLGMRLSGPSNPRGCKLVVYKPSNPQFANQGGVMASARTLKLAVTTIEKNICGNTNGQSNLSNTNAYINAGSNPINSSIYKSKTPACNPANFTKNGNPKTCTSFINSLDYQNRLVSILGVTLSGPKVATNGVSTNWSGTN